MGDKKNSTDGTDIWPLFFNSTLYHQVDRGTTSLGSILFTLFYLFHLFQEYIRVYNDKDDTYRWLSAKENGTEASVPHLCHICTTNPIHLTYTMDTHKKSGKKRAWLFKSSIRPLHETFQIDTRLYKYINQQTD